MTRPSKAYPFITGLAALSLSAGMAWDTASAQPNCPAGTYPVPVGNAGLTAQRGFHCVRRGPAPGAVQGQVTTAQPAQQPKFKGYGPRTGRDQTYNFGNGFGVNSKGANPQVGTKWVGNTGQQPAAKNYGPRTGGAPTYNQGNGFGVYSKGANPQVDHKWVGNTGQQPAPRTGNSGPGNTYTKSMGQGQVRGKRGWTNQPNTSNQQAAPQGGFGHKWVGNQ